MYFKQLATCKMIIKTMINGIGDTPFIFGKLDPTSPHDKTYLFRQAFRRCEKWPAYLVKDFQFKQNIRYLNTDVFRLFSKHVCGSTG